jgi:hypothetical protein
MHRLIVLLALAHCVSAELVVGATRLITEPVYQELLQNRTVGILTNPTGVLPGELVAAVAAVAGVSF